MGKDNETKKKKLKRVLNPEAREKQLISLAMDAAEEQLLNGTASSQVINHFLKSFESQKLIINKKNKCSKRISIRKIIHLSSTFMQYYFSS